MDYCILKITDGAALDLINEIQEARGRDETKIRAFLDAHGASNCVVHHGLLYKDAVTGVIFEGRDEPPPGWRRSKSSHRGQAGEIWCSPDLRTRIGKEAKAAMRKLGYTGFERVAELLGINRDFVIESHRVYMPVIGKVGETWVLKAPTTPEQPCIPEKLPGVQEITSSELVRMQREASPEREAA